VCVCVDEINTNPIQIINNKKKKKSKRIGCQWMGIEQSNLESSTTRRRISRW